MTPDEAKAMEEAAKAAKQYLDIIVCDPLAEIGLLIKDNISYWRFKNQLRIVEKTQALLAKKGIKPQQIANSVLPESIVPLLEAGGDTSDPMLSDMFAGLLTSAISPESAATTHPSFARILNQLSPMDAKILRNFHAELNDESRKIAEGKVLKGYIAEIHLHRQLGYVAENIATAFGWSEEVVNISFQNLRRLGVCDYGKDFLSLANQEPRISFTDFGMSFIKACTQNLPAM